MKKLEFDYFGSLISGGEEKVSRYMIFFPFSRNKRSVQSQ